MRREHVEDGADRRALGFVAGQPVTVVAKLAGSVILNIRGTRVALDKKLAARVMI